MRLSVVFELLLVFLFLAFAAARVIDPTKGTHNVAKGKKKTTTLRQGPPNRYCACTSRMCNCCRDFSLPVVPLKGPGCASIMYVSRDTMMVTMSFGDRVLSNTTISGKTPKPICMALPGGISQFCGRVYGISRKGEQFRACLGLELRALDDIEAALRVSCFKFGPKGVKLESAPPVPAETGGKEPEEEEEDDYDDDDDDLIGFGVDDEDDAASSEDNEVDSDSVDYTGFSVLGEDILGTLFSDDSGSSTKKKKPSKKTAKPQAIVPKISTTTTRRPILPNRRRSTVKPLSSVTVKPLSSATFRPLSSVTIKPLSSVTIKPQSSIPARPLAAATSRPLLNRITKRPAIITRPQAVQKPSVPVPPVSTIQTAFLPISPTIVTQQDSTKIITKSPTTTTTTEAPPTTVRIITTVESQESEKLHTAAEETSQETTVATEEPITFTIPTHGTENVKNDISLPQTDLDKLEAVAAIAQQDVTSGVIPTSSLTSEETEKPVEIVTVKYEKITPSYYPSTEKISSIKFVPTTVVTSRPSAELADDDSLEETIQTEIATNSEPITNKIIIYQQPTVPTETNKIDHVIVNDSPTNITISLKKQPSKKPVKQENDEDDEDEEEEEEAEEDLLEGVLSDDEESDNEEAEEDEEGPSETNKDDETSDDEEAEEEEEDSGEDVGTSQKPTKVSIKKKKPASDDDEEEEEEEEEDILEVLGDDDEEEESDDDDDEEDEPEKQKKKKKKKPTTEATTIKIKKPTTQQIVQTRKPVTTTPATTPAETTTERVTEKVFIYTQPMKQVTENVIIYQEPDNKIPNKIFIYKQPENPVQSTEKVIFYKEPSEQTFTEKYVIYKEPETTEKPAMVVMQDDHISNEETKDESDEDEKIENDDDNSSSEEELEDDNDSGKLVASIVKPGFSNKYAEEHDLTDSDDLDIEDPEDDFEEDRKMKENQKKPVTKPPPTKKPQVEVSKPKILTLSDLIGQRRKFYDHSKDDKPISTSRTHRRMNLDRFLGA